MNLDKIDIKSLSYTMLEETFKKQGYPTYRVKQVYDWLHKKFVKSFDEMSNLPKEMIEFLKKNYYILVLSVVDMLKSKVDGTNKVLFALEDQNVIETVWMEYQHGNSVCISTQAGCRMGCAFCASTIDGLERNLKASEMLEQIYQLQALKEKRVSHIVIMGSGEPFDNYEEIISFLHIITDEKGLNISPRNITISTCGLVPEILRFASEKIPVTLAISLHAPNDVLRQTIMPIAKKYPILAVLDACQVYFNETGRRLTFEYIMLKDINDSIESADELARLLRGYNCHVNLIPGNPVEERPFQNSSAKTVENFRRRLERSNIQVTIRREMGRDINGACGQLRKTHLDKN